MEQSKQQSPVVRLKDFAMPNKGKYLKSIILAILGVAFGLVPYFAVARMIIQLINGGTDVSFYMLWCGLAAGGYIGKVLFSNWSTMVSHSATFVTLKEIRKKLISKLSRMPMGILLDTPSGRFKDTIVDRVESPPSARRRW